MAETPSGAHPTFGAEEECCADCRRPYTCWWADSDLWNAVIRPYGRAVTIDGVEPFLCSTCFLVRAEPLTDMARVTWPDVVSKRDRARGRISPVRGYMVLLFEYGHWSDNWDGAVHETLDQAREQREEAEREGHVACVIQALEVPGTTVWLADAASATARRSEAAR